MDIAMHVLAARNYILTAATHRYMFVLIYEYNVYIVKFDDLTVDVLVAITTLNNRATGKGGGLALRLKRNKANYRAIIELGQVVYKAPKHVFEDYFEEWQATHKGNRGNAAEAFVALKMFGITDHVGDLSSYKTGADVNGYQVKFQNGTFAPMDFINA